MKKPIKYQISEKNISLAGARTHESDYFRAAQYLGCKPIILNIFYKQYFLNVRIAFSQDIDDQKMRQNNLISHRI